MKDKTTALWAVLLTLAFLIAARWLWDLTVRPVDFIDPGGRGFEGMRITGLALVVGTTACVVALVAARRRLGTTLVVSCATLGILTVVAAARRPVLSDFAIVATNAAWLVTAAAAFSVLVAVSPRLSALPRILTTWLTVALAVTGVAAAALAGGSGIGSVIGTSPSLNVPAAARVALGLQTLVLLGGAGACISLLWPARRDHPPARLKSRLSVRIDPVITVASVWLATSLVDRAIHLYPVGTYRDSYRQMYRDWALIGAVRLPMLATGAVVLVVGWSFMVRPSAERLAGGRLVLPDRDPIAMLRDDLAAWVGDPSLRLAYSDGNGRWVGPSGEVRIDSDRYDRATTILTREGRQIGILEYDIALSKAPDAMHTAVALAGVAVDANQLLAVREGLLVESQRLGERLLIADAAMRAEVESVLEAGPLATLRDSADRVVFGATLADVAGTIRQATAEVRQLSHGLYPPELIEDGLSAVVGDRRGAPRRRLPAAVEVTAFRLATVDSSAWFEDRGTMLAVHVRRDTIPRSVLDRIDVLGGVVSDDLVMLPIDEA
jgi:hypothetical protein